MLMPRCAVCYVICAVCGMVLHEQDPNKIIETRDGDTVCMAGCGTVLEDHHIDHGAAHRVFQVAYSAQPNS